MQLLTTAIIRQVYTIGCIKNYIDDGKRSWSSQWMVLPPCDHSGDVADHIDPFTLTSE